MDSLRITNLSLREFLAECLGTFVLTTIGCCTNAAVALGGAHGSLGAWGWGMALTAAIFVSGGVSGGHVNPAVTLGMASVGKLPWAKIFHYFAGQYIGAFAAAAVTYAVYYDMIEREGFTEKTAGIFATFPTPALVAPGTNSTAANTNYLTTCFIDQVVCVSFFLLIICAITDEKNMTGVKAIIPIAIGVTDLGLMVIAFGTNCGAPVNPARDLAPRLFTAIAGWEFKIFKKHNYYAWIPVVACHIGGILGCWIYRLFIENHWPDGSYNVQRSTSTINEKNGPVRLEKMEAQESAW